MRLRTGVMLVMVLASVGLAHASVDVFFNGQQGFTVSPTQAQDTSYSFDVTMYDINWQTALGSAASPPAGSDWVKWFGFWIGKGGGTPPISTADGTAQDTVAPVWKGSNGQMSWGVAPGQVSKTIVDDGTPSAGTFPAVKTFVITPDSGQIPTVADWSPDDFSFHLQWQDQAGTQYTDWVQGGYAPELPPAMLVMSLPIVGAIVRRFRRA